MHYKRNISKILFIIGGFLCYVLADGCTFSIGILYQEFLNVFHSSRAATAVLPGLIYALPQMTGPIISPLVDTIGSANGAFIGAILLSFSFFVSRFVVSLELMYVTMGFLSSIGLELTYISGIMAVTKGFVDQKYMGLALGITVSGSGVGVFLFNPLLTYLIEIYTWQGALTVTAGIFLHIFIAGALFKLSYSLMGPSKDRINKLDYDHEYDKKTDVCITLVPDDSVISNDADRTSNCSSLPLNINNINLEQATQNNNNDNDNNDKHNNENGEVNKENDMKNNENNNEQSHKTVLTKSVSTNQNDSKRLSAIYLNMTQTKHCEPYLNPVNHHARALSFDRRINNNNQQNNNNSNNNNSNNNNTNILDGSSVTIPMDERTKSYVRRLSLFTSQPSNRNDLSDSIRRESKSYSETRSISQDYDDHINLTKGSQSKTSFKTLLSELRKSISSLCNRQLWTNWKFLTYLVISFLFATSVVVPWTFTFDHSLSLNIPITLASLMVSMIGAGSCISQIIFGLLSDHIPAITIYSSGCIVAGIFVIVLRYISPIIATLSYGPSILMACHFLFGCGQGVSYALFSVILVNYVGMELYPAALGVFLLISGVGNLIGTYSAGYINDNTKSYNLAYEISGGILIICAFLALPLCWLWHRSNRLKDKEIHVTIQ